MKRTELKPGKPLKRKTPLQRRSSLDRVGGPGSPTGAGANTSNPTRAPLKRGRGFAASPAQQKKARTEPCVVTGEETLYGAIVDPAHLWPRAQGGCDDPLCTVPLVRHLHTFFDEGEFDLLPYLVKRRLPELHHALDHANGDLCALLHRLTGERPYGGRRVVSEGASIARSAG